MSRPSHAAQPSHFFESLEARALLSTFSWDANEVYMLELVNRARANPQAEGQRYGIDLTEELTAGELARLVPSEPLALNSKLTVAARLGSEDMAKRGFFDHVNPDGDDPTDRAKAQGYVESAGENIAAGYSSVEASHIAWLKSVGHRRNVLSLHENFDDNFHYDEFGAGFYFPESGERTTYNSYYTQLFGYQGVDPDVFLLGVVYRDDNTNNFYNVGEGVDQVRIDVYNASSTGVALPRATYTTAEAGNYQIALDPGNYRVIFTDMRTGRTKTVSSVTIAGKNVKLDAKTTDITGAPAADGRAAPGAVISGSYRPGTLTVTTLDPQGRPIVFQQTDIGTWRSTDLHAWVGGPLYTKQVSTWTDPKDGNTYAAAPSPIGLMLFRQERADGSWEMTNLGEAVAGSTTITSEISVFTTTDGIVKIVGKNNAGHLVMYYQLPHDPELTRFRWAYTDLTAEHLQPQGLATPEFVGNIITYVTSWNGQNIAGLDAQGRIQVVWWAPSMDLWAADDLSSQTGAPPMSGGLTVYLTPWGGINLAGADSAGKVSATWWVPGFLTWSTTNLSDQYDGPPLAGISITSYVTPWGGLNIAGLNGDGKLVIYWWAPPMDSWSVTVISDMVADSLLPTGPLRGQGAADGSINVYGRYGPDASVLRYWWKPDGVWQLENLTELT